jgi:hypothetical protein
MAIKRLAVVFVVSILGIWLLDSAIVRVHAPATYAASASGGARAADVVPPFHTEAPQRKKLPATLDPMQFPDPITQNAYAMAAKVKPVLYQQPCYCHCDREYGHSSLLDCFTGTHAAVCNICKWEAIYAYTESGKKKTAAQIREGIMKGEALKIDLAKYREYQPPLDLR